jgi:hypothetical protein
VKLFQVEGLETVSLSKQRCHERKEKTKLLSLSTTAVEDKRLVFVGMLFSV